LEDKGEWGAPLEGGLTGPGAEDLEEAEVLANGRRPGASPFFLGLRSFRFMRLSIIQLDMVLI